MLRSNSSNELEKHKWQPELQELEQIATPDMSLEVVPTEKLSEKG